MRPVNARLIHSGASGARCPNCRRPTRDCVCPRGTPGAAGPPRPRVGRATQGRAGKGVTTVSGLPLPPAELDALAATLKKLCGSGGTVRDGVIEIQGEHRERIVAELVKLGWPAKRSGG